MSPLRRRTLLAAAGTTLLAGCSATRESDGPESTPTQPPAETPSADVDRTTSGAAVETRWDTFVPGRYTLSTPALDAEAAYLGSDRELRRIERADGAVAWEAPLDALTHPFTPAVGDEHVFAAARNMVGGSLLDGRSGPGRVAALDTADGTERWRAELRVTAAPTLATDRVLVPTTDDGEATLRALARTDGDPSWRVPLGSGRALAEPTVAGDLAVVPTTAENSGRVTAVALADGTDQWDVDTPAPVEAPVAVARGTAYVPTTDGTVLALDVADGSERWRTTLDGPVYTRLVPTADAVFVAVGDTVRALDPRDGTERWRTEVGAVSRTGLAVADGRIYVGGTRFSSLDAATGDHRWTQRLSGIAGTFGAPAVRDGVIYTGACVKTDGNDPYDHHVYALEETAGAGD